ncbi:MAG TPA: exo-beta-N-acetylmuramidase NamZ domain-containing protein [Vicinamibacterales bacterium]
MKRALAAAALVALGALSPTAQSQPDFEAIAPLIDAAIARHELPGAVVLVGRGDEVLYRRAFGQRAVLPTPEAMTEDTIFDLASLTKVVATTTSVMQLVESGRIRLADPVTRFLPDFGRYGKDGITIRHLMTHTSGLRPDLELEVEFAGADEAIRRAIDEVPVAVPDERFLYSDINFFVLGEIVRVVSGERIDAYANSHVFAPLAMTDTTFLPPAALRSRIAPTERCQEKAWPCSGADARSVPFLRGIVHDPTARRMDGVAGHAGLFSTAADLSRFCRALLNGGSLGGARILAPATIARMTTPSTPAGMRDVRGLGWDIDSTYSANRGDLFPIGSYGHTGFTGTSLWLDPASKSYVIFLSNRVHPDGKGDVTALRGRVATIAAAALLTRSEPYAASSAAVSSPVASASNPHPPTLTGLDVLATSGFAQLRGKRVGLVTNHTGRTKDGTSGIDVLAHAPDVRLVALFSPEHGIRGQLDDKVASSRDEQTGLPVYSLYGDTRRPAKAMLDGLDAIVFDVQDIGARFYTYPATLGYVMEAAAQRKLPVVVLDRPNPVNGVDVEGPFQDESAIGFNGYLPMPIRHGMTIGELARLFNEEKKIGADLTVVAMKNWRRGDWFDETALPWTNPSPNMRSLPAATLYPGMGAIEGTNISVGRGTDDPFDQVGAPWIDGNAFAAALNARGLPGVRFYPIAFTPAAGAKFGGQSCHGVFMVVTDRDRLRPVRVGLEMAAWLSSTYGEQFKLEDAALLLGSRDAIAKIRSGADPSAIAADWKNDEEKWRRTRAKYLLY